MAGEDFIVVVFESLATARWTERDEEEGVRPGLFLAFGPRLRTILVEGLLLVAAAFTSLLAARLAVRDDDEGFRPGLFEVIAGDWRQRFESSSSSSLFLA